MSNGQAISSLAMPASTLVLARVAELSKGDRERVDALLALSPARHLADAVTHAIDAGDPPTFDVSAWTAVDCGEALAAAVLLFKANGGEPGRVFRVLLIELARVAAGRMLAETRPAARREIQPAA